MVRTHFVRIGLSLLGAALLTLQGLVPAHAAKPTTQTGRAYFRDDPDDSVVSDGGGRYSGTLDRDGNFSFSTGTQRAVSVVFGTPLALLGSQTPPTGASVPYDMTSTALEVSFKTLSPSAGGSLLGIPLGASHTRSVEFGLPADPGGTASRYTLHFRGNALFDDNGNGVSNEPYPLDGTEMSRMLVTCDAADATGCRLWTFETCAGTCTGDSNPDGVIPGTPVGQLYGTFSKNVGTRPVARYAMPWGLTVCRETTSNPCPN